MIASGNCSCRILEPDLRARPPACCFSNCSRCSSAAAGGWEAQRADDREADTARNHLLRRIAGCRSRRRFFGSNRIFLRGNHRHGQSVFHRRVHRRAHDDLRVFALAADLFHHAVDLGHRQILSAHQAHQHGVGFGQRAAFVEQRMREQFFHDLARARRRRRLRRRQTRFRNGGRAPARTNRRSESESGRAASATATRRARLRQAIRR